MPSILLSSSGWRLGINRKIALLFSVLALVGFGNWLVVYRAQEQIRGAETNVNVHGSLRYLSQKIQVELLEAALERIPANNLEKLIAEFETNLERVEAGGKVLLETVPEVRSVLASVRSEWVAYRDEARRFNRAVAVSSSSAQESVRLSGQAEKVLEQANRATWALSKHITSIKEKAVGNLIRLALLDAAILVFAFLGIRRQIVLPLRKLAQVSLRFAGGEYGIRSGFRSRDEIGHLAESFDFLAAETERHIEIIAADLVQIKQKKDELRKLSQAVVHSPASVVITDAEGTIQYVNPMFVEVSGYSFEEAVGRKPSILKSGGTPAETYAQLWKTLRSGGVWRGELMNRRKNGELFWENTQISPVRNSEGGISHFVAVKEDVTARKHAEQALAMLNIDLDRRVAARTQELEAANKELRSFSYSVSHDLRTPLRAIHGFAHAIEEDCGNCLDGESRDFLQRIQKAAARMGELIDDLLELSRIGQMEVLVQSTNLSHIANSVLNDLAIQYPGRKVEIAVEDGIVVSGDPRLLRIVLENLLGNAWKFTAGREPARIAFGYTEQEGKNVLTVSDNGAGFNLAFADKLFLPFHRLHNPEKFEGTGIGLATVLRAIQLHGGRIWAHGEVDKGASFHFVLPEKPPVGGDELELL